MKTDQQTGGDTMKVLNGVTEDQTLDSPKVRQELVELLKDGKITHRQVVKELNDLKRQSKKAGKPTYDEVLAYGYVEGGMTVTGCQYWRHHKFNSGECEYCGLRLDDKCLEQANTQEAMSVIANLRAQLPHDRDGDRGAVILGSAWLHLAGEHKFFGISGIKEENHIQERK